MNVWDMNLRVPQIMSMAHDDAEAGREWAVRLMRSGERIEDTAADRLTFDMIR